MISWVRSHLHHSALVVAMALLTVLATAQPASAQQLIDASKDGDLAFAAFAFMVLLFVGLLFTIDWVRKRSDDTNPDE